MSLGSGERFSLLTRSARSPKATILGFLSRLSKLEDKNIKYDNVFGLSLLRSEKRKDYYTGERFYVSPWRALYLFCGLCLIPGRSCSPFASRATFKRNGSCIVASLRL